jgi:hypothetical protein
MSSRSKLRKRSHWFCFQQTTMGMEIVPTGWNHHFARFSVPLPLPNDPHF